MKAASGLTKGYLLPILMLCLNLVCRIWAQDRIEKSHGEPEVRTIFPMGGNPGTTVEVEIRGKYLEGTYAVWFGGERVQAKVKKVEEVELREGEFESKGESGVPGYRVLLQLEIAPGAKIGPQELRLISERGVSNAINFMVNSDPVIAEIKSGHSGPSGAQLVPIPAIINGEMSRPGELDYYQFDVAKDEELTFDCFSEAGFDPQFALYEPTGSWFDPSRATRLAFNDDPSSEFENKNPRLTYRFRKPGRYLLEVGAFLGNSAPHAPYQLRIAPSSYPNFPTDSKRSQWLERSFTRKITPAWLESLWVRTLETPTHDQIAGAGESLPSLSVEEVLASGTSSVRSRMVSLPPRVIEREPNDATSQAVEIAVPSIVEGAIAQPGDIDSFRFKVKSGQRLAFEIETPLAAPPRFNPQLTLLEGGREFLINVYKRIGRNFTFYLKTVEPKTIYTFEKETECELRIRDATSRWGDPSFRYRVLIRPQIPHIGEIDIKTDHVNLVQGEARKLAVTTAQEEGFAGDIALALEGLPPGVEAFPATEVKPDKGPPLDEGYKERFLPKTDSATIILAAADNASVTTVPKSIRITARPIVGGQPGSLLVVRDILLMVVKRRETSR
ncbi:MAG: hypothetical protein FJW26_00945 [Acidimicrobiia bacterium]|nr:hypothetical protein [Acidimicrobiia bacterium]